MSVTKKEIIDDIMLRVSSSKPSSDLNLGRSQLEHFVDLSRDKFVSALLVESAKFDGNFIDPTYIKTETALSGLNTTPISVAVTQPVLSVPKSDHGMIRVMITSTIDSTTVRVHEVDLFELSNMEAMEFTAPSALRPVYYRKEQTLYFKGLANAYTDYVVVADYVESMVGSTSDYSISEAHLHDITLMAENMARQLLGVPILDNINDGDQNSQTQNRQRR